MGRNRKPEQRMQPGRIIQKELEKMRYKGEKRKTRLRRQKTMACVVGTQVVARVSPQEGLGVSSKSSRVVLGSGWALA